MIDASEIKEIKRKSDVDQVKIDKFSQKYALNPRQWCHFTRRDREVVDFTRSRVKNNTEFINLMISYKIEGYNGK